MNAKRALITGVTGQDGAYLAKFLLERDYEVFGAFRRVSTQNFTNLRRLGLTNHPKLKLVEMDLTDLSSVLRQISAIKPSEIYNLAAQSFVGTSFEQPLSTANVNAIGAINVLEGIRLSGDSIKFYQASTSEMFGLVQEVPQNESTMFYPRSPYGVSKLFAHWSTINYRESYGLFASSGILFNHESPLRGREFVTRKISEHVAKVALGFSRPLSLGNLSAKRDWGYAGDYVEGMWSILQADQADTFVLATERAVSVREFVTLAFEAIDVQIIFEGEGLNEVGRNAKTGTLEVQVDDKFYRPSEVEFLIGDATKAKEKLGWRAKMSIAELSQLMVLEDIKLQQSQIE